MRFVINWVIGVLLLLELAGVIFAVSTAHARTIPPAVSLWTLWVIDEDGAMMSALMRFTTLDACYHTSLRLGFLHGIGATCLPYRLGDFE
jgi:hypothetical protein